MKHILFLTRSQFGYHSDYFYFCKYLANSYRITIVCIDAGKAPMYLDKVTVINVSKRKLIDIFAFWIRSFRMVLREKPDLTVINFFPFSFLFPMLLGTKHILFDIRSGGVSGNMSKRWLRNSRIKLNIVFNQHISVISDSLARALKISPTKYHFLPLGSEVLSDRNKSFENLTLLYIGTFNGRRLIDTIKGFSMFYNEFRDQMKMEYHIVGDGNPIETQKLNSAIEKEGLSDIIKLYGRINHSEAKVFFETCNIGVSYVPINAYYTVQPPTKTFEYLCSGLAVIGTSTLENSKVIKPHNGILIEDTAYGFYKGLKEIRLKQNQFTSQTIRNKSIQYTWEYIVQNSFQPIIESILK